MVLLNDVPLTEDEAGYVDAARAANTLRGYRSDWREFTSWCAQHSLEPLPLDPTPYSAHSLRAGFVTYAHLLGASDRAIAHQTRHRSLATLGGTSGCSRPGPTTPPPCSGCS